MKNSKQIADSVFKIRDEYVERQNIRNRKIRKVTYICSTVCMICLVVIGVHHSGDIVNKINEISGREFILETEATTESTTTETTVSPLITTALDDKYQSVQTDLMEIPSDEQINVQTTTESKDNNSNISRPLKPVMTTMVGGNNTVITKQTTVSNQNSVVIVTKPTTNTTTKTTNKVTIKPTTNTTTKTNVKVTTKPICTEKVTNTTVVTKSTTTKSSTFYFEDLVITECNPVYPTITTTNNNVIETTTTANVGDASNDKYTSVSVVTSYNVATTTSVIVVTKATTENTSINIVTNVSFVTSVNVVTNVSVVTTVNNVATDSSEDYVTTSVDEENNTNTTEPTLPADDSEECWDYITQQYETVFVNGNEYSYSGKKSVGSIVGDLLYSVKVNRIDEDTGQTQFINVSVYTVMGYSQGDKIAVKFEGYDGYYIYTS